MKTKSSRFDSLVARYYPAVYSFAARLTDDPREAVALTREAFNGARKQLQSMRSQTAIATVLIAAVLRAGLGVRLI
jgi:DNA-directed RNA polymerase specialized sigma24 family protein